MDQGTITVKALSLMAIGHSHRSGAHFRILNTLLSQEHNNGPRVHSGPGALS